MRLLLTTLGRLLAASPEVFPRVLCAVLGDVIWYGGAGRRRVMLGSLRRAFPTYEDAGLRRIGRRSCRRTVELGLFAVASPYFSEARARAIIRADASMVTGDSSVIEPRAQVVFVPHFSMMEMICFIPLAVPELQAREIGTFYRPLDNPTLNAEVKRARERFGLKLISRKDGFKDAMGILRRGGIVAALFDQNAGWPGSMSLLFNRVASTTELPGILAERYSARTTMVWSERTGFWRATMRSENLVTDSDSASITIGANRWLEKKLSESESSASEWLWLHNRWKSQAGVNHRLALRYKREITAYDFKSLDVDGWQANGDRFVIRMSNWLGDVVMALPLVRAIRESRPDAHITLLAKKAFRPLLESTGLAQRILDLPTEKGAGYRRFFRSFRTEYPDTHILFTNSFRGDHEAWMMGSRQRFGMVRPGKWRPLLTDGWKLPVEVDERTVHQTRVWERWLREAYGLEAALTLAPFRPADWVGEGPVAGRVGLVCGTENTPAKRWPVEHWRVLVEALLARYPGVEIRLFGTPNDVEITGRVAAGFDPSRVLDLAGKTGLVDYCKELLRCSVIACNDTGGMHLANMLGVPVVAIFGPTNPVRTGPVFEANAAVLQPPGAPATGGVEISGVTPERVIEAVSARLGL